MPRMKAAEMCPGRRKTIDEQFSAANLNSAKRKIVRHDDAMPPSCTLQDFVVATAKQPPLVSRPPVTASCPDRRRRQQ